MLFVVRNPCGSFEQRALDTQQLQTDKSLGLPDITAPRSRVPRFLLARSTALSAPKSTRAAASRVQYVVCRKRAGVVESTKARGRMCEDDNQRSSASPMSPQHVSVCPCCVRRCTSAAEVCLIIGNRTAHVTDMGCSSLARLSRAVSTCDAE